MKGDSQMKRYRIGYIAFSLLIAVNSGIIVQGNELTTKNNVTASWRDKIQYDTLSIIQMEEDIDFLHSLLKENQSHFNEALFLEEVQRIKENLSNYDDITFRFAIAHLLASAKDAHTMVFGITQQSVIQPMLPIGQIAEYDDGWYIKEISKDYGQYLGKKIIAVNGYKMKDIIKAVTPYVSTENIFHVKNELSSMIQNAKFLQYIGIIQNTDVIPITVGMEDGKQSIVKIKTINTDNTDILADSICLPSIETQKTDEIYRFYPLDDTTLFIQCNQCYEEKENPISSFRSKLNKELDSGKYEKVIFDLRYNTGGNYPAFEQMTADVGKKAKNLFVLIGNRTFSAGVMQAIQLKDTGATLVGKPTGGNVNFYANNKNFELPNSHIKGCYSTAYMDMWDNYTRDVLYPDIESTHVIKDTLEGIDSDVQMVLHKK